MAASVLVDTGALLALLDDKDEWHGTCLAAVRHLRLPLATSEAVLTELFLSGRQPCLPDGGGLDPGAVRHDRAAAH